VKCVWLSEAGVVFGFLRGGNDEQSVRLQGLPDVLQKLQLILLVQVLEYLKTNRQVEEVRFRAYCLAAACLK